MCGHLQRKPERLSADQLLETLRIYKAIIPLLNDGDFYPGSSVDILVADPEPKAIRSTWWFLLGHDGKPTTSSKPSMPATLIANCSAILSRPPAV